MQYICGEASFISPSANISMYVHASPMGHTDRVVAIVAHVTFHWRHSGKPYVYQDLNDYRLYYSKLHLIQVLMLKASYMHKICSTYTWLKFFRMVHDKGHTTL